MTDEPRIPVLVRIPAKLLRKIDRLTARSRRNMGVPWSRNDEIVSMLSVYEPPDPEPRPPGE